METSILEKHFGKMGARVKFQGLRRFEGGLVLDIGRDKEGEFFSFRGGADTDVKVVNIQPKDRHLLLVANIDGKKSKFLCGHDERQWFVAAVPSEARNNVPAVVDVKTAMEALKPQPVVERQAGKAVQGRRRRRNEAYVRQGEWFFVPAQLIEEPKLILRNEPIRRGGGKPHMCEFLAREGGRTVWVGPGYPNGITEKQFKKLNVHPRSRGLWRTMVRDAGVFVKGKITHPDHATIVLKDWYRVMPNTEGQAGGRRFMAFLD